MPLYVYTCSKCSKMYELSIKLKDFGKRVECPHCKKDMKRLVCPVPFKFN